MLNIRQIARLVDAESYAVLARRVLSNGRWEGPVCDYLVGASHGPNGRILGLGLALQRGAELAYAGTPELNGWAARLMTAVRMKGGVSGVETSGLAVAAAGLASWCRLMGQQHGLTGAECRRDSDIGVAGASDDPTRGSPVKSLVRGLTETVAAPSGSLRRDATSLVHAGLRELGTRQRADGLIGCHLDGDLVESSRVVVKQLNDIVGAWQWIDIDRLSTAIEDHHQTPHVAVIGRAREDRSCFDHAA